MPFAVHANTGSRHHMNGKGLPALLKEEGQHLCGEQWQFQQDNGQLHAERHTQALFGQKGIHVMEWPFYSPDLDCMKNAWG